MKGMLSRIEEYTHLINRELETLGFEKRHEGLYDPLHYILSLGGKRIRPLLVLLGYSLFKDEPQDALSPAIGLELFHNFTLMHDDIMDDAPIRRGYPTVHVKWNPNKAILSGDVMLIKAYEYIMKVPVHQMAEVMSRFNCCALEVCEGQELDMQFEGRDEVLEEEYLDMIRLKTATLLGLSLEMGGILADQDCETKRHLNQFGINMGIGFQLKDDLLDVFSDNAKFGKQRGGDIIANKKTFLLIEALKIADDQQKSKLHYWINCKEFDPKEKVGEVVAVYDEVGIQEITHQKINQYFSQAFEALESIPVENARKDHLRKFAHYLINREK